MEKDLIFIELFEVYKELLTKKQRQLFSSYYLYDLSLSEIAEEDGGTRQSVYDAVKKVKAKLLEYEKALKLNEKTNELKNLATKIKDKNFSSKIMEIVSK